jgi:hypothetical protein
MRQLGINASFQLAGLQRRTEPITYRIAACALEPQAIGFQITQCQQQKRMVPGIGISMAASGSYPLPEVAYNDWRDSQKAEHRTPVFSGPMRAQYTVGVSACGGPGRTGPVLRVVPK